MYGETRSARFTIPTSPGLSPHVRGNQRQKVGESGNKRSIPACTGKPQHAKREINEAEVYPRMYGETAATTANNHLTGGLSPHVRGNPTRPALTNT